MLALGILSLATALGYALALLFRGMRREEA
jgi:hypothetical protein